MKHEARFLAEFGAFLRSFTFERQREGESYWLNLPGHEPIPFWPARRQRLFGPRRSSSDFYEPVATAAMSFLLHRFSIRSVYDIGASAGYFSYLAASVKGIKPIVHAFEMNPGAVEQFELTRKTTPYCDDIVHFHNAGVSDHEAAEQSVWYHVTTMFEKEPQASEYRESLPRRIKYVLKGTTGRNELRHARVLITSVDAFAERHGPPHLIKLDVDGYEAKVIPGGMRTLTTHRPFLLLELHKNGLLGRFGTSREELMSRLFAAGYYGIAFSDQDKCIHARIEPIRTGSRQISRETTSFFLLYDPGKLVNMKDRS